MVGEWVTLDEFARRSGLSIHAARRRAKSGTVQARRIESRHGPAWEILLNGDTPAPASHNGSATVAQGSREGDAGLAPGSHNGDESAAIVEALHLVRDLQTEMVRKAEAATMWQARAEFLAAELSQAREQLALMAPSVQPAEQASSPLEMAPEPTPEAEAGSRASTRRWWPFWSLLISAIATVAGTTVLFRLLVTGS